MSTDQEAASVERTELEQAIALGTVTLTAAQAAPRLGYRGKKGLERFRAACAAKVIPAFRDGQQYRIHWPSVTAALFAAPKAGRATR